MQKEFPKTVSYNRFVELKKTVIVPLGILLKINRLGNCTGVLFIDSTPFKSVAH